MDTSSVLNTAASAPGQIQGMFSSPMSGMMAGAAMGTAIGVAFPPIAPIAVGLGVLAGSITGAVGSINKSSEELKKYNAQIAFNSKQIYDPALQKQVTSGLKYTYTKEVQEDFDRIFSTINKYQKSMTQQQNIDFSKQAATELQGMPVDTAEAVARGITVLGVSAQQVIKDLKDLHVVSLESDIDLQSLWESVSQLAESTRLMGGDIKSSTGALLLFENAMKITGKGMRLTKDDAVALAKSIIDLQNSGASGLSNRAKMALIIKEELHKMPTDLIVAANEKIAEVAPRYPKELMLNGKPRTIDQLGTFSLAQMFQMFPPKVAEELALRAQMTSKRINTGSLKDTLVAEELGFPREQQLRAEVVATRGFGGIRDFDTIDISDKIAEARNKMQKISSLSKGQKYIIEGIPDLMKIGGARWSSPQFRGIQQDIMDRLPSKEGINEVSGQKSVGSGISNNIVKHVITLDEATAQLFKMSSDTGNIYYSGGGR